MSFNATLDRFRRAALDGLDVPSLPAPPDPKAVRNATLAQGVGASLEAWLNAQHRYARNASLALVRHVGPPVSISGTRGEHVRVIGRGPADYQGVARGGRALAIEAKSRHARLSRAEIPEHQQADLDAVAELGGVALLVVEVREAPLIACVPWREVPWRESERRSSGKVTRSHTVGAAELERWRCEGPIYLRRFV